MENKVVNLNQTIKFGQYLCQQLQTIKVCYEETQDLKTTTQEQ